MKPRIIDLSEPRSADDFPAYAAVFSSSAGNPQLLSPTSMRWSDDITLSRLQDCKQFWIEQKKKLRCKLTELFDPLLRHHYGDDYVAVFANHPWQCLLYLHYQRHHQGRGLYLLHSRLDQNIYRTLDWECWFDAQSVLATQLEAINARGFQAQTFRAQQARMRRFIQRIGVANAQEMSSADANSVTRRFGKWLGMIWQWTFTESSQLQGFPWIKLAPESLPSIRRDLEHPVNQWTYIEMLLREDLLRLCEQFRGDDCVHINRMLWEITLFNDHRLAVELSFRHPYSLHRDRPDFATALYQARYVYDDLMRKLQARDHDLDLPEHMPFLCWRIEVCERVLLAPQLWQLFDLQADQVDYQQIMSLQNKLPIAFESFQATASFYAEQSFARVAIGRAADETLDHYPWSCAAVNKPLFYYHTPRPIDRPSQVEKIFLERESGQWWLSHAALQSIRDHFILRDRNGRLSWAFRDQQGAWFKQGEYY